MWSIGLVIEELLALSIVGAVLRLQIELFRSTKKKAAQLATIFADQEDDYVLSADQHIDRISPYNEHFLAIQTSLNRYIGRNRNRTIDFHILRDIVDRNCDAAEDEIQTQIPVPLYYGLMATMGGIIVGVGALALRSLLGDADEFGWHQLIGLFMSVGIAMIASAVGIVLTTLSAGMLRTSKRQMERDKQLFISWMQSELLPEFRSDVVDAINNMAERITLVFGDSFERSTQAFQMSLRAMESSVETLAETDVAATAREVAGLNGKLKESVKNFDRFGDYIAKLDQFIARVQSLEDTLGEEQRALHRVVDMSAFFMKERSSFQSTTEAMTSLGDTMQRQIAIFSKQVEQYFAKLGAEADRSIDLFRGPLISFQKSLSEQLGGLPRVVESFNQVAALSADVGELIASVNKQADVVNILSRSVLQSQQSTLGFVQGVHDLQLQLSRLVALEQEKSERGNWLTRPWQQLVKRQAKTPSSHGKQKA